jgi:hypothetical protein
MEGLTVVKIDSSGAMVVSEGADGLTRGPAARVRRGQVTLPTGRIEQLRDLIKSERIFDLKGRYSAEAHDGTQWILLIEQRSTRKSVYLDNEFPDEVQRLAHLVDEIVRGSTIQWYPSSPGEHETLERGLWQAVRD